MVRHKHHFKIAFALAIAAGSWGVYWLPQRILEDGGLTGGWGCLLYTSPSPRDLSTSRMPSSA